MKIKYLLLCGLLFACVQNIHLHAQTATTVIKVTSPIQELRNDWLDPGAVNLTNDQTEPYKSGYLTPDEARRFLGGLGPQFLTKTTIINVLRWKDSAHTAIQFQNWYVYDPTPSKLSFYIESKEQLFKTTAIAGRTDLQFVYIHFNADLSAGQEEYVKDATEPNPTLKYPVSYTITTSKQQTQFIQDVHTLLNVLGVVAPTAKVSNAEMIQPSPSPGYFSVTSFQSQWNTSTITIAATLDAAGGTDGTKDKAGSTATQLLSQSYTNAKPSWLGLSAGVPINSYKDVKYQQSSGTLTPSTITQQNVYVFLDGYIPPALPTLTSIRYIPHPLIGLPIKGKVFRHTMVGGGIGLRWIEIFGGVIFDTENSQVTGSAGNSTQITYQSVYGVKISISALSTALKK